MPASSAGRQVASRGTFLHACPGMQFDLISCRPAADEHRLLLSGATDLADLTVSIVCVTVHTPDPGPASCNGLGCLILQRASRLGDTFALGQRCSLRRR